MITKNSIDLTRLNEPCFALTAIKACRIMGAIQSGCCTYKCPFYKPRDCKSWVRIEDRTGINLIPPEEAFGRREK